MPAQRGHTKAAVTKLDIVVDLQYGDSGKGKVAHFLCKEKKYINNNNKNFDIEEHDEKLLNVYNPNDAQNDFFS